MVPELVIVVLIFPSFLHQFQDVLDNIICTPMPDGSLYYHDLLGATEKVTCIPLFLNGPLLCWSLFSFPAILFFFGLVPSLPLPVYMHFTRAYSDVGEGYILGHYLIWCFGAILCRYFKSCILVKNSFPNQPHRKRRLPKSSTIRHQHSCYWICFNFSWRMADITAYIDK